MMQRLQENTEFKITPLEDLRSLKTLKMNANLYHLDSPFSTKENIPTNDKMIENNKRETKNYRLRNRYPIRTIHLFEESEMYEKLNSQIHTNPKLTRITPSLESRKTPTLE